MKSLLTIVAAMFTLSAMAADAPKAEVKPATSTVAVTAKKDEVKPVKSETKVEVKETKTK